MAFNYHPYSGSTLSSSLSSSISYNHTPTTITSSTGSCSLSLDQSSIKCTGNLIVNGEDISERIKRIEERLHIPSRNVILEEKYQKLKDIWIEYTETLNAIKTWETIKES